MTSQGGLREESDPAGRQPSHHSQHNQTAAFVVVYSDDKSVRLSLTCNLVLQASPGKMWNICNTAQICRLVFTISIISIFTAC